MALIPRLQEKHLNWVTAAQFFRCSWGPFLVTYSQPQSWQTVRPLMSFSTYFISFSNSSWFSTFNLHFFDNLKCFFTAPSLRKPFLHSWQTYLMSLFTAVHCLLCFQESTKVPPQSSQIFFPDFLEKLPFGLPTGFFEFLLFFSAKHASKWGHLSTKWGTIARKVLSQCWHFLTFPWWCLRSKCSNSNVLLLKYSPHLKQILLVFLQWWSSCLIHLVFSLKGWSQYVQWIRECVHSWLDLMWSISCDTLL